MIEEFSAYLSDDPNTSPRTAEFYEADLKEFARFLADKNVTEVEGVSVGAVMEFRRAAQALHRLPKGRRCAAIPRLGED